MKNRFVGLITVTFPDGYEEKCMVKEKAVKGEDHFMKAVKGNIVQILRSCGEGNVKVNYKGDLARTLYNELSWKEKVAEQLEKDGVKVAFGV